MNTTFLLRHVGLAWAACLVAAATAAGQDAAPPVPRVVIEDHLAQDPPVALRGSAASLVPVGARVVWTDGADRSRLDARLAGYRDQKVPVWLAVSGPASPGDVPAWRSRIADLAARHREGLVLLEILLDGVDVKLAAFAVRTAATDARSADDSLQIAVGGAPLADAAFRQAFFTDDLGPYVDVVAIPHTAPAAAIAEELRQRDPGLRAVVTGRTAGASAEAAVAGMIDSQLDSLGTPVVSHAWRDSAFLDEALRALVPLSALLAGDVSVLDAAAAGLRLSIAGEDRTSSMRHRLLFDERTFATFLAYWAPASGNPLDVSLTLSVEGVPAVYRLADAARLPASGYTRHAETGRVQVQVPAPGGAALIAFNEGAAEVFVERSGVSAERLLTVDEIIARHQQQQRTQDALVRSYMADARMSQHFRPTMTDPGYDVVTENRYYVADDEIEWEELSFSVNGSRWGSDRPPFPLLQPEKVLSLPLQLRFDADYRYRLTGTGRAGGRDCYVIAFEPLHGDADSLYRGTLWIDKETFGRVQVRAVQTNLSAPVVSNEETQSYTLVTTIGDRPVFLFTALEAKQIMLIAGRNLLVEKAVEFSNFRVNDDRFAEERIDARRGEHVMYKETDRGLRYFVKDGEQRIVSERATRSVRAMAMGVTLDPSYSFPLPIFGINYLNFEVRRRPDTQLAVLFAGVLAAGNLQRSRLGGSPFDASVDFFAIGVPSSERLYDAGGEREAERLLTWPLTAGANIGWQYTPFQKLTGQYQFRFDGFARERTTAESFRVPASTLTNGFGAAWEYRRAGYSAVLNGTWYARAGWREWGLADSGSTGLEPRYLKYTASLSKDFFFNIFHKIHLNAAWFGGRDLDRFAKYQFGMFDDTRIHGVPASGVRFGELAALRGSYSLNIFEQYRLDLFLEQAWGRDRAFDELWQPITGIGAAVNFRAPWNTMLRADVGKSFLPDRYRGVGSTTLQIMLLKPLK